MVNYIEYEYEFKVNFNWGCDCDCSYFGLMIKNKRDSFQESDDTKIQSVELSDNSIIYMVKTSTDNVWNDMPLGRTAFDTNNNVTHVTIQRKGSNDG